MSFVDFSQRAEDHRNLIILVKQVGNNLKPKAMNFVYDCITKIKHFKIASNERTVHVRFVRNYHVENAEWGDFQAHRKVLGLVSVGKCSSENEVEELYRSHEGLKTKYSNTLFDSRLILLGLSQDGSALERSLQGSNPGSPTSPSSPTLPKSPQASQSNSQTSSSDSSDSQYFSDPLNVNAASVKDEDVKPTEEAAVEESDPTSLLPKDGILSHILCYPTDESCASAEMEKKLQEFVESLFWVLESKRLDRRSLEKQERLALLTTPFEKKDMVGIDTDTRMYRKRCQGRLRKYLGDLCLLANVATEAVAHYQTALDILRSANDWLWLGAAYEGLCSATVIMALPAPDAELSGIHRNQSFSIIRGSSALKEARQKSASLGKNLGNGVPYSEKQNPIKPLPPDLIDKYKEAVTQYGKFKNAGIIEMEASLKACRVLISQQCRQKLNSSESHHRMRPMLCDAPPGGLSSDEESDTSSLGSPSPSRLAIVEDDAESSDDNDIDVDGVAELGSDIVPTPPSLQPIMAYVGSSHGRVRRELAADFSIDKSTENDFNSFQNVEARAPTSCHDLGTEVRPYTASVMPPAATRVTDLSLSGLPKPAAPRSYNASTGGGIMVSSAGDSLCSTFPNATSNNDLKKPRKTPATSAQSSLPAAVGNGAAMPPGCFPFLPQSWLPGQNGTAGAANKSLLPEGWPLGLGVPPPYLMPLGGPGFPFFPPMPFPGMPPVPFPGFPAATSTSTSSSSCPSTSSSSSSTVCDDVPLDLSAPSRKRKSPDSYTSVLPDSEKHTPSSGVKPVNLTHKMPRHSTPTAHNAFHNAVPSPVPHMPPFPHALGQLPFPLPYGGMVTMDKNCSVSPAEGKRRRRRRKKRADGKEGRVSPKLDCDSTVLDQPGFSLLHNSVKEKLLAAADFLQNVVYINIVITEEEKTERFHVLSKLYGEVGMVRKAGFYKRITAMQSVAPSNPNPAWSQCYRTLLEACRCYGHTMDIKDRISGPSTGWPLVQLRVLHELIYSARKMGNPAVAIRHLSYLLHTMWEQLSVSELRELCAALESYTAKCEGTPQTLALDDGTILPPVPLLKFPSVKSCKLLERPPHFKPIAYKKDVSSRKPSGTKDSPFIYSPLQLNKGNGKKDSDLKMQFCWVQGDLCELSIQVYNPLPFELHCSSMGVLTEGVPFESYPANLSLPAASGPFHVKVMGTAKEPGLLTVLGYTTRVMGVRSHCRFRDMAQIPQNAFEIDVVPCLPQLTVSTSLPKAEFFSSMADSDSVITSATTSIYAGQRCECLVKLVNTSEIAVEKVDLLLDSKLHPDVLAEVLKWDRSNLDTQLPIEPGGQATIAISIHGYSSFISPGRLSSQPDVTSDEASSAVSKSAPHFLNDAIATSTGDNGESTWVCESLLKVQYSGGPGLAVGYCRQCSIALTVEVKSCVLLSDWEVTPMNSVGRCLLRLDVENQSNSTMVVSYGESQEVTLDGRQTKRIGAELPQWRVSSFPRQCEWEAMDLTSDLNPSRQDKHNHNVQERLSSHNATAEECAQCNVLQGANDCDESGVDSDRAVKTDESVVLNPAKTVSCDKEVEPSKTNGEHGRKQNVCDLVSKHVTESVDVRWHLSDEGESGSVFLDHLWWTDRQIEQLSVQPVEWRVEVGGMLHSEGDVVRLEPGQLTRLLCTVIQHTDISLDSLHVEFECGGKAIYDSVCLIGNHLTTSLCQIGDSEGLQLDFGVVFMHPGSYLVNFTCTGVSQPDTTHTQQTRCWHYIPSVVVTVTDCDDIDL